MAERSNAAVLKTVEVKASGGSNPSPSAKAPFHRGFFIKQGKPRGCGYPQPRGTILSRPMGGSIPLL